MNSSFDKPNPSLKEQFLAPVLSALSDCPHTRSCPSLSDTDWLLGGVERCLEPFASGRDFLQKIGMLSNGKTTYFESLKSKRRGEMVKDVAARVEKNVEISSHDLISEHLPELDDYDIWAGDGHWHSHATHDKKVNGKYQATGHLYGLNLRRIKGGRLTNVLQNLKTCSD